MHRRRLFIVAAFACWMQACSTYAQIDVRPEYGADEPIILSVADNLLPSAKVEYSWSSPTGKIVDIDGRRVAFGSLPGTTHEVSARVIYTIKSLTPDPANPDDLTKATWTDLRLPPYDYKVSVVRKGVAPPPTPVPPTPVPPTPNPPGPVPIVETGLRVLIVYDADSKASLPREQMALLDSPTFRAWLDAHCVRSTDGTSEWRIAPHETEFNADQPVWQKAMALPRQGLPWLVVSNGTAGESVPLPANEAAAIALIGRYAP